MLLRFWLVIVVAAAVASSAAGCTRETSSSQAPARASGPITDSGSTGLRASPGVAAVADGVRGKEIFQQNCASCHGAKGTEGGIGPSLRNERARKASPQVEAWIKNPVPPMPKLYPAPLNETDVVDVTAYIASL